MKNVNESGDNNIDFILKTAIERDPNKRRVKPVESQASLLNYELDESSDDSDFRIEDHEEVTDDDSANSSEGSEEQSDESDSNNDELNSSNEEKSVKGEATIQDYSFLKDEANKILICSGCLGDRSDGSNEIVECDDCGATVHEMCYGVSESNSVSSTNSGCPTAPWFCESCKAGVTNPSCELCPNEGGIFKRTDVGKWVHLVCALYVPGIAFGEVDVLSNVTLFEMPYNRWGARTCFLCHDIKLASTGVCISCDAGMCRTYFHVTCAQREGLLSEAHLEEVGQADPFYAHCKLHVDKALISRRKRNYLCLQMRMRCRKSVESNTMNQVNLDQDRIKRKLEHCQQAFQHSLSLRPPPWVPTQKMCRLLNTSPVACKLMMRKANYMDINTEMTQLQETQAAALVDVRKKWHLSPAFTAEYIAYFLDRNNRINEMKHILDSFANTGNGLIKEQSQLRNKYDNLLKSSRSLSTQNATLKDSIGKLHSAILNACPRKYVPNIENIENGMHVAQRLSVPTAAALKLGVGFPLSNLPSANSCRLLSGHSMFEDTLTLNDCHICHKKRDQHLLVKCDTCKYYYHLYCLSPPLARHPKKSKLYGWQCANCDKSSESEVELTHIRRSGSKYRKINTNEDTKNPVASTQGTFSDNVNAQTEPTLDTNVVEENKDNIQKLTIVKVGKSSNKKKKRNRHKNREQVIGTNFEDTTKSHKRKKKKRSDTENYDVQHPRITIKIKSIPIPPDNTQNTAQMEYVYTTYEDTTPRSKRVTKKPIHPDDNVIKVERQQAPSTNNTTLISNCGVCKQECLDTLSVRCDECSIPYHFTCLDPPVRKTPKRRGYSWHCADCDDSATEEN